MGLNWLNSSAELLWLQITFYSNNQTLCKNSCYNSYWTIAIPSEVWNNTTNMLFQSSLIVGIKLSHKNKFFMHVWI